MALNSRAVPHLRVVSASGSSSSQLSDAMLAAAWATKEPWAQEALWKRYAPLVFSLLQTGLGSSDAAEVLTRRVFAETFARSPRVSRANTFPRLLIRRAAGMLRRRLVRRRVARWFGFGFRSVATAAGLGRLEEHEVLALRRLYEVLEQLAPLQRCVFVLFELEGFNVAEIGDALELSTAAAERQVRTASARFQALAEGDLLLAAYLGRDLAGALDVSEGA
jgi:DNA-directed RNA polymerase specialized sigma24 family protein